MFLKVVGVASIFYNVVLVFYRGHKVVAEARCLGSLCEVCMVKASVPTRRALVFFNRGCTVATKTKAGQATPQSTSVLHRK